MVSLTFLHSPEGRTSSPLSARQVTVSYGLVRIEGREIARLTDDLLWRYDGQDWTDFTVASQ